MCAARRAGRVAADVAHDEAGQRRTSRMNAIRQHSNGRRSPVTKSSWTRRCTVEKIRRPGTDSGPSGDLCRPACLTIPDRLVGEMRTRAIARPAPVGRMSGQPWHGGCSSSADPGGAGLGRLATARACDIYRIDIDVYRMGGRAWLDGTPLLQRRHRLPDPGGAGPAVHLSAAGRDRVRAVRLADAACGQRRDHRDHAGAAGGVRPRSC